MPAASSLYRFIVRYKLYHIPFWMAYHFIWWSVTVGNPLYVAGAMFSSAYGIKNAFYIIVQALGVYFNLYFLVPRFLEKGRYVWYVALVLLVTITTAALIVPGYYISARLSGQEFQTMFGVDPANYWYFFQINTLPSSVASMTLAMSVKLAKNWIQSRRREEALQKQHTESELQFLKYQLNPHFLFNTMNSIFFLIKLNPDKASNALATFSDLLRHQLYESADHEIPLAKELQSIGNFVELEKLRQNEQMEVFMDWPDQTGSLTIAPFILMTFAENAFKHVSRDPDKANSIRMKLTIEDNALHFIIANTRSAVALRAPGNGGGIGLPNVRRRLALLYPGRHELTIEPTDDCFTVQLKLEPA